MQGPANAVKTHRHCDGPNIAKRPPSTRISIPETNDAFGETRNRTISATSSARPIRPTASIIACMIGCCECSCLPMGVSMSRATRRRFRSPPPPVRDAPPDQPYDTELGQAVSRAGVGRLHAGGPQPPRGRSGPSGSSSAAATAGSTVRPSRPARRRAPPRAFRHRTIQDGKQAGRPDQVDFEDPLSIGHRGRQAGRHHQGSEARDPGSQTAQRNIVCDIALHRLGPWAEDGHGLLCRYSVLVDDQHRAVALECGGCDGAHS